MNSLYGNKNESRASSWAYEIFQEDLFNPETRLKPEPEWARRESILVSTLWDLAQVLPSKVSLTSAALCANIEQEDGRFYHSDWRLSPRTRLESRQMQAP